MLREQYPCTRRLVWMLLAVLALYGCGGDESDENGDGNQNLDASRTQVTRNTLGVVDRVLEIVIGDEAGVTQGQHRTDGGAVTRQEPVRITIPCDRGEVSFRGEVDNGASEDRFTIDGVVPSALGHFA